MARFLAATFAIGAAERDRLRQLPYEEIERFSASGLWAITVPRAFGGADALFRTVANVIEIISAGSVEWPISAEPSEHRLSDPVAWEAQQRYSLA